MGSRQDNGVLFALLLSFPSLTIFAHGIGGGSIFTGILLATIIIAPFLLGRWPATFDQCDIIFVLFVVTVAISLATRGNRDLKEVVLLLFSLAAYPATRFSGLRLLTAGYLAASGTIVISGSAAALYALVNQWDNPHGKPELFGAGVTASPIAIVMCFTVIGMASLSTTTRQALLIGAALFIPTAIFSASMVRFSLLALLLSILAMANVVNRSRRRRLIIIAFAIAIAAIAGLSMRPKMTAIYISHAVSVVKSPLETAAETCSEVDRDNSIAIRLQLYKDAGRLFGKSGWFGIGFNEIALQSCDNIDVHNSIIQAFIEFGFISGLLLVLLVTIPIRSLISLSVISTDGMFALGALIFVMLVSMAHGKLSRDIQLFAILGYAASIRSRHFKIAKDWMLRRRST